MLARQPISQSSHAWRNGGLQLFSVLILLLALAALISMLSSCVPSEEEIMHRNKRTVLEHLDIGEHRADIDAADASVD